MNKIRCAVIGVGYLGKFHAEKYAGLKQAELIGVVDQDKKTACEIAEKYQTTAYTNYEELIGKVDAVSIVTPTLLHYEVAKFFLSHRVHVLVEKPITSTVNQANELIALAKQHNVILQVGHLERFNSVIIALNGILTEPKFIESQRIAPFTLRGSDVNVILDVMIHDIDLICSMVKSPLSQIMASGAPILTNEIDIANVRLQFENGCVANVTASRAGLKTERLMRIFQSDAYIALNLQDKKLAVYRKGNGEMFPGIPNIEVEQESFDNHDAIKAEIIAFLDSVANGKPVIVSGEAGRDALKIAHDITTAINTQWEKLHVS